VELGLSPRDLDSEAHLRQAALELLHRGSLGLALLSTYGEQNPGAALQGIVEILSDPQLASSRVNAVVTILVDGFHSGLDSRPDHEIAALHGFFQVLGETSTIAEGVTL